MNNQKIYLYDGTFKQLLNLIKVLIQMKIKPLNIQDKNKYIPNLIDETVEIDLSKELSYNCLTPQIQKAIYYVYLSEEKNKELIIFYFILNTLKYNNKIFYMRNLNCVDKTLKTAKQVGNEFHKLKGFLRFQELNGHILYAKISPSNNILDLLSKHFSLRLPKEKWIIYDEGRNLYSIYNTHKYYIVTSNEFSLKEIIKSENEDNVKKMWLSFFNTIGIKERTNRRCQINFMPKKYWKYIIEMSDEYKKSN